MKKVIMEISGHGKVAVDIVLVDRITKIKEQAQIDIELVKELVKECKTEAITTTSEFPGYELDLEKKNKKGKNKKNWER